MSLNKDEQKSAFIQEIIEGIRTLDLKMAQEMAYRAKDKWLVAFGEAMPRTINAKLKVEWFRRLYGLEAK